MAQIRASTVQQKREEVHAALQNAASVHCLVEEWRDCEVPERTKRHVGLHGVRPDCMRCWTNSKNMKMPRRSGRSKVEGTDGERRMWGGHDMVRRVDPKVRAFSGAEIVRVTLYAVWDRS